MKPAHDPVPRTVAIAVGLTAVVLLVAAEVAFFQGPGFENRGLPLGPLCAPCLGEVELLPCPTSSSYTLDGCVPGDDEYNLSIAAADQPTLLGTIRFWINGTSWTYQTGPAEPTLIGAWTICNPNGSIIAGSGWPVILSLPSGLSWFTEGSSTTTQLWGGDFLVIAFGPETTADATYGLHVTSAEGGSVAQVTPP